MVEMSRLRFLQAVHRCGAVGAAARQLGYTPSAVSQQIGKLEREVGLPLLEPAGRGVVLTDAALVLVEAATAIDHAREQANGRIEELLAVTSGETVGTVSVACFPSAIRGVAAPALGALAQTAPRLRVDVVELAPEPAREAVVSGRVDVAVVHDWVHDRTTFPASLETTHLADDPVDLLVPTSHPLATRSTARLEETVDDVWVTDVSNGICTRWILDMLRASATEPRVDYRVEEYASQVALVAAGLCVCVLPRIGRPSLPDTVRPIPLEGPVPTRRLIAAHRTTTSRRPAVQVLIRALQEQIPD